MKCILSILVFLPISIPLFSQSWLMGGQGMNGLAEGYDIAADDSGNVYITGEFFQNSLQFGTFTLYNTNTTTADIFIAKFNAGGDPVWAQSWGAPGIDQSNSIAVDQNTNVCITGTFNSDTLIIGNDTMINSGQNDAFVAKFTAGGTPLWAKSFSGAQAEQSRAIACDDNNNIIITGQFNSSTMIMGTYTLNSQGGFDAFTAKMDPSGNVIWARSGGGNGNEIGYSIAADNADNVIIAGSLNSSSNTFGTVIMNNTTGNSLNPFVVKYDSNGNATWGRNYGCAAGAGALGVNTDADNNIFFTGYYNQTITIGSTVLGTGSNSSVDMEMFAAALDSSGTDLWAIGSQTQFDGISVSGYDIAADPNNGVFIVGGMDSSDSLSIGSDTIYNPGPDPMFIAQLGNAGNVICLSSIASGGDDESSLSIRNNRFFIGGDILCSLIFGYDTLVVNSSEVPFIAQFAPCDPGSVHENPGQHDLISIYPNPSSGIFTIRTNESSQSLHLVIYDTFGQIIREEELAGSETSVDATAEASGIYFYMITDEQKILNTGKLIIAK